MTDHHDTGPYTVRKLWPVDFPAYRRHLLRLDPETRHSRFGGTVSDYFLNNYPDTAQRIGTVVFGGFRDGEIYATAELRPIHLDGSMVDVMAEAAFVVEKGHQHHGLGSALMDRIITTAQNHGIHQLHMICMRDNDRMRKLAARFGARLKFEDGEVLGEIEPAMPTPASMMEESVHDAEGYMTAMLDWRS
jgi:GNAT superfamily N-acetyltransferase